MHAVPFTFKLMPLLMKYCYCLLHQQQHQLLLLLLLLQVLAFHEEPQKNAPQHLACNTSCSLCARVLVSQPPCRHLPRQVSRQHGSLHCTSL
jgi:hypothetical protein